MPRSRPLSTLIAAAVALAVSGCATMSAPAARSDAYEDLDPDVVALFLEAQMIRGEPVPEHGDDSRAARAVALLQAAIVREPGSAFLRRYLAEAFASDRETTKAIAAAEVALKLDPTDGRTHYVLGLQYLQSANPELAEGHFREASRRGIGGDTPWKPHQLLFGLLRTQGRVDEAISALTVWMEAHPSHPEPATLKASYLWGVGHLEAGVEAAESALAIDPASERATDILATYYRYDPVHEAESLERVLAGNWSNERLHRRLVDVYDQMGRYDVALSHLRYVGILDSQSEGERVRRNARLLRRMHRSADAVRLLSDRLEGVAAPEALDLLALAEAQQDGSDLDAALETLRRVPPEDPQYPTAARARVRVQVAAGRHRAAVEAALAARQLVPGDRPRVQAGLVVEAMQAAIAAGQLDEAARLADEVLALDPSRGAGARIDLLTAQGEVTAAADELRALLEEAREPLSLVGLLSDTLVRAGRYDEAIEVLNDGVAGVELRRDETIADVVVTALVWEVRADADNEISWLLLRRSFVEKEAGRVEESAATLESILLRSPQHPDALNSLGYLLAEQDRDLERAEQLLAAALAQRPYSAAFQDSMGWVLYRQGRYAEAVERLEEAAAWEVGEPEIDAHLAEARRAAAEATEAG